MEETLFYVFGITLVVAALVVSAVGLRWEKFPGSRVASAGVVAAFAALVVATGAFAWLHAEEEQEHREAELAEEQAAQEEEGDEAEGAAGSAAEGDDGETTVPSGVDGAQVFADAGCGGCHTLAAAESTGATGPDLDGALAGQSASEVETSIVDPNEKVAEGFPPNVMPQTYGEDLSPDELRALVQYLLDNAGGQG